MMLILFFASLASETHGFVVDRNWRMNPVLRKEVESKVGPTEMARNELKSSSVIKEFDGASLIAEEFEGASQINVRKKDYLFGLFTEKKFRDEGFVRTLDEAGIDLMALKDDKRTASVCNASDSLNILMDRSMQNVESSLNALMDRSVRPQLEEAGSIVAQDMQSNYEY